MAHEPHDAAGPLDFSRWHLARLGILAVIVLGATAAGTSLVMHAFPFAMDEYVAGFQARVFASGALTRAVGPEWQPYGWSMTPVYVSYDTSRHLWTSQYLPVYSGLRAAFLLVNADRFVNPLLAAASLPLVYACARRLWPDNKSRAWVAVGLLALSSQLLFMSMTSYAMPAHLLINLLWLYAYLRGDRASWIALPVIGAVALGVHNPFPHALFVAPFLLAVVLRRQWGWTAYFAVTYLAAIGLWLWWGTLVSMGGGRSLLGLFEAPNLMMVAVQGLSLTLMLSWQTPIMAVALLLTALSWRRLSATERVLGSGILLSFGFFLFFPSPQGHGWGYRYTFAVLGNMVLLAAIGVEQLHVAIGQRASRVALAASAALTLLVQLPVRSAQIERYVRPFADANRYIETMDADVVIVDPTVSWYGIDLVRNDPFLENHPKVISAFGLRPDLRRALAAQSGLRVHMLRADELAQFGLPTFPSRFKRPLWPPS